MPSSRLLCRSGQVPEEGALAEVDEKRILKFMIAHPEEWKPLMATISTMPNVSKKELDEFNAANPALLQGSTASVGTSDARYGERFGGRNAN